MSSLREHEVVGNSNGFRFGEDNWVYEEGVEGAKASDVQIDVHAAIVMENEISNGVGALNGVGVCVERVKEPRVMLCDELPRTCVRPEHIFTKNDTFSTGRANEKGPKRRELTSRASFLCSHPKYPSTGQGGCLSSRFGVICVEHVPFCRAERRSILCRNVGRRVPPRSNKQRRRLRDNKRRR